MKGSAMTLIASTALIAAVGSDAEQVRPHPVPCRIEDGVNTELMVATLGTVDTPLAQGMFDPTSDKVTLKDGTKLKNYYRDRLGIKNYTALDKTYFPLPPSGWCTLVLL